MSVSRVKRSYEKRPALFVKRFLSECEADYCLKGPPCSGFERLAGHIAAKEAVMKVLGKGWPHIPWTDIEILHEESGQPWARLKGKALLVMKERHLGAIVLSITHDGDFAAAMALGIPRALNLT